MFDSSVGSETDEDEGDAKLLQDVEIVHPMDAEEEQKRTLNKRKASLRLGSAKRSLRKLGAYPHSDILSLSAVTRRLRMLHHDQFFLTPLLLPACHNVSRFVASFLVPLLYFLHFIVGLFFIALTVRKYKTLLLDLTLRVRFTAGADRI